MKNTFSPNVRRLALALSVSLGFIALPSAARAASISPDSFEATIGVGETTFVDKTVTLDPSGVSKIDLLFLADNTGSMGGVINSVKAEATSILSEFESAFSDIDFGVARYLRDPSESPSVGGGVNAYELLTPISSDNTTVIAGINSWFAGGGFDFPEANLYALQQAATEGAATPSGVNGGAKTGWREGAKKVIAIFGDAPGHEETITLAETIAALNSKDVTVALLNSRGSGSGLDDGDGFGSTDQASAIADATGGVLVNNFRTADVKAELLGAIGEVTSTISLAETFSVDGDYSGVDVAFSCTDAAGCDEVGGGESRDFRVTFTGTAPGKFDFETSFTGVLASERDIITVTGVASEEVPTPALLPGLIGMGVAAFRKRKGEETAEA